jgi:uncharacterized membrane protein HdeD (DUF308 family)
MMPRAPVVAFARRVVPAIAVTVSGDRDYLGRLRMTETSTAATSVTPGRWSSAVGDDAVTPFPWWSFLVTGILGVAFGVAVLTWPDVTLRVMAVLVGCWFVLGGLARILGAFLPYGGSILHRVLSGVVGIVVLVGGLVCLRDLVTRLTVLALIFSITWILGGITAVVMGTQYRGGARIALIVAGGLSLIAGTILAATPSLSLTTLVILTGISSLIVGLSEIVMAFVIRHVRPVAASTPR